jgi:hypothetical protein
MKTSHPVRNANSGRPGGRARTQHCVASQPHSLYNAKFRARPCEGRLAVPCSGRNGKTLVDQHVAAVRRACRTAGSFAASVGTWVAMEMTEADARPPSPKRRT